jgi:hypothetical protein
MDISDLETFVDAYIECALWSSNDESTPSGGEPMDANYDPADLSQEVRAQMVTECADFIEANLADLADMPADSAGHDFWLTRNGHGAGFWDRGLGELGQRLTRAAKVYRGVDLYVGDDGKIYA